MATSVPSLPRRSCLWIPYGLCLLLVVGLLAWQGSLGSALVDVALGLQLAVCGGLYLSDKLDRGRRAYVFVGIAAYVLSAALLRQAVGAGAGYGLLLQLPVVWAALGGRWEELAFAIAGVAVAMLLPTAIVGAPLYPPSSWRQGVLSVVLAGAYGGAVLWLVSLLQAFRRDAGAVLAATSDGLALVSDGRVVAVNRGLIEMTGFSEVQLLGAREPFPFVPRDSPAARAIGEMPAGDLAAERELTLVRADGCCFDAAVSTRATGGRERTGATLCTIRDVTEAKAHQRALRSHALDLSAIAAVTYAIGRADSEHIHNTICHSALTLSAGVSATIWDVSESGPPALADGCGAWTEACTVLLRESHAISVVAQTRAPLFVPDAGAHASVDPRVAAELGARSMQFEPVGGGDGARAVLVVCWRERHAELPERVGRLLAVIAEEGGVALERADLLARLRELSRTDELTELPNRRAWKELLAREVQTSRRGGEPLSVVMLDLDHFKAYNDEHGHLAGDELLRSVARAWATALRANDVLARWGGEEFGLLVPGCGQDGALRIVDRLRALMPDGITFSAGVAVFTSASTPDTLVGEADRALYEAKARGRACTVVSGSDSLPHAA